MASLVQSTNTISAGNTNLAFGVDTTAGNFLIVAVSALTTGQTFTVTDSAGNTYRSLAAVTDAPNTVESQIFFVPSCLEGASTVTFTPGAAVATVVALHEFSGVERISARGNATGSGTSAASPTMAIAAGFAFGFISSNSSGTISAIVPGTGWTQGEVNFAANPSFITEWRTTGGSVAATATATLGKGATFPWTAQLAGDGGTTAFASSSFGFLQWTGW